MQHRVQDGFSILLPVAYMVRLFGDNPKLSRIMTVPPEHLRPCLILNMSSQPDEGTSSVNGTTDREFAPESIQFGRNFSRIL